MNIQYYLQKFKFLHPFFNTPLRFCITSTVSGLIATACLTYIRSFYTDNLGGYIIPLTISFCCSCPFSYISAKVIIKYIKILERKNQEIEEVNQSIKASIRYASLIQQSLLPAPGKMTELLPENFIIWMPRDIIGGDIYQMFRVKTGYIFCVIDCTGHGVPGALMTMLASSALRTVLYEQEQVDPGYVLTCLNRVVANSLHQDTDQSFSDDGLDASLCLIEPEKRKVTFAGAGLPLCYIRNNDLIYVKGDKRSIGYRGADLDYSFSSHVIDLDESMSFYLFTDGYHCQPGGEKNRPLGRKKLKNMFYEYRDCSFEEQKENLLNFYNSYRNDRERVDDVTIVGFRL